jgi:hypothetical protein
MESEQEVEAPTRNTIWIKIAIGLLVIVSIGQISAMLIPATVGTSPEPISLFGSILWLGLLFMSICSLKGKKKIKGFMLGAIIGLLLYFFVDFTAGYLKAEERAIDRAVAVSNEGLPKMLDEGTRFDSVTINQKEKTYSLNFSLVNLLLSEIDVTIINETFESSIKPASCSNESFKIFFNEGYKIDYAYKDKAGQLVAKYTVNPTDCQ